MKEKFSKKTPLGRRRTDFSEAPEIDVDLEQSMIEKEPVTVVCSEKGWIRTMKGHLEDVSSLTYKDGDKGQFTFHAMTTDKVMLFSSSGKFFTLDVAKLPGGRGHGEPVRLMCDLDAADRSSRSSCISPGHKRLLASTEGDGFIVPEDECVATTRKGKQVLNVKAPVEAAVCAPCRRMRPRRLDRREPQDDHLQARRSSRNGARQGRAPAEVQGRRPE